VRPGPADLGGHRFGRRGRPDLPHRAPDRLRRGRRGRGPLLRPRGPRLRRGLAPARHRAVPRPALGPEPRRARRLRLGRRRPRRRMRVRRRRGRHRRGRRRGGRRRLVRVGAVADRRRRARARRRRRVRGRPRAPRQGVRADRVRRGQGPGMTRGSLRSLIVRTGAAAALAVAAAPVWASPAGAQDGGCEGAAVVVDPGEGRAAVGCAEDPSNGLEALAQAGFTVVEVGSFPGAVCRIDGFPETACGPMPPADASWTYWYADAAGAWTYSSVVAAVRDPDAGDVDG